MLRLKSALEIWHGQQVAYPIPRTYQVPFLFFVLDPSMNLSEDSAEKIGLRCIICNTVICMDAMRDGNGYWYKY